MDLGSGVAGLEAQVREAIGGSGVWVVWKGGGVWRLVSGGGGGGELLPGRDEAT